MSSSELVNRFLESEPAVEEDNPRSNALRALNNSRNPDREARESRRRVPDSQLLLPLVYPPLKFFYTLNRHRLSFLHLEGVELLNADASFLRILCPHTSTLILRNCLYKRTRLHRNILADHGAWNAFFTKTVLSFGRPVAKYAEITGLIDDLFGRGMGYPHMIERMWEKWLERGDALEEERRIAVNPHTWIWEVVA